MSRKIDLTGQVFGRLTAIKDSGKRSKQGHVFWVCMCSCGEKALIIASCLRNGNSKSCGCKKRETGKKNLLLETKSRRGKSKYGSYANKKAVAAMQVRRSAEKQRKNLGDLYIKCKISTMYGLPFSEIDKEMVEIQRTNLSLFRLEKTLRGKHGLY